MQRQYFISQLFQDTKQRSPPGHSSDNLGPSLQSRAVPTELVLSQSLRKTLFSQAGMNLIHKPFKLPSNVGFVATFSPGCGIKKHPMLLKHDLMCLLTCISSECCFSVMSRRFSKIWFPPVDPYGASYGKLQSRTKNTNLWNTRLGRMPIVLILFP